MYYLAPCVDPCKLRHTSGLNSNSLKSDMLLNLKLGWRRTEYMKKPIALLATWDAAESEIRCSHMKSRELRCPTAFPWLVIYVIWGREKFM